mmetsp:Transcript_14848/g.17877  ORF Transcript_14848/g.17877 Transcript_14848/m.17877 type:complete len:170 (+) Transcript_14848:47-556(+)|eukprot:CAMPEP_0195246148 /NCGR_PEP_ID=MMETSP0706-20130129/239_1 /TAXON_ID=33640 /ORGANISM="Asterionellopsis glacialis, Strain CCMP134" /LENGTH=169 /DNA_ID=CAMNT_0040297487 /DNA_START=23 /DNA_END=532 /DNA_ORIENTATION=+
MKVLSLICLVALVFKTTSAAFVSHHGHVGGVKGQRSTCTARFAAAKGAAKKAKKAKTAKKAKGKAKSAAKKDAPETFKKPDFIKSIQEKTDMTKAESEAALQAVLETITEQVVDGKRISLLGFGTFQLSHRAARLGRNPKTGEEIQIKASKTPAFKASKVFKEQCNPGR